MIWEELSQWAYGSVKVENGVEIEITEGGSYRVEGRTSSFKALCRGRLP